MARTEARLFTSIWNDPDWRALSLDAQHLYLLLLSQPDVTQAGTLSLAVRRWAGMSAHGDMEQTRGALTQLERRRFVVIDYDTEEVLIRSMLRRDGAWKSHKTLVYAARAAQAVLSPRLRAVLLEEVQRVDPTELKDGENRAKVEGHLGLLRASLATPSDTPPDTPSGRASTGRGIPHPIPTGAGAGASSALEVTVTPSSSSRGAASQRRGTRLPTDWVPSADEIGYARDRGLDPSRVAEDFRDYWHALTGKSATKLDWSATWRKWCRNEADRRGSQQHRPSTTDQRVQAGLDLARKFAEQEAATPQLRMISGGPR